jgi:hypothetical protein
MLFQKNNHNLNKNIEDKKTKKNIILSHNKFRVNNNKNKKNFKIKKAKTIEGDTNSKNLIYNLDERNNIPKNKNILKGKILIEDYNTINNNKNDENKNIFKTKYDYIVQKGEISNGPVEIPSDIEIQNNLNQKEWSSQKKKLKENVKRSDIIKKIQIFNNKKNNNLCSNILKKMKENEKELIIIPYAKEKQKVYKTINAIGHSNGITYLKISLLSGGNEKNFYNNFINNIRKNENKKNMKMNMLNFILNKYINKAEIDLS